jgi:hypothetical protein
MTKSKYPSFIAFVGMVMSLLVAVSLVVLFPIHSLSVHTQDRMLLVFLSISMLFGAIGVQMETGKASSAVLMALALVCASLLY